MNREEFDFFQEEEKRKRAIKDLPLFDLGTELEDHHYEGKKNSPVIFKINKSRHDFITRRLNYFARKYKSQDGIILLANIEATYELIAYEIRHVLYLVKDNPSIDNIDKILVSRGFNKTFLLELVNTIMEEIKHE